MGTYTQHLQKHFQLYKSVFSMRSLYFITSNVPCVSRNHNTNTMTIEASYPWGPEALVEAEAEQKLLQGNDNLGEDETMAYWNKYWFSIVLCRECQQICDNFMNGYFLYLVLMCIICGESYLLYYVQNEYRVVAEAEINTKCIKKWNYLET